jgi:hypothetical protein
MTPKEKAFSLYFKYIRDVIADDEKAKKSALVTVDEIIQATKQYSYSVGYGMLTQDKYWQEVKTEIEKL